MTPATLNLSIRPASLADLPELTRIHNYYVSHTHITFDVDPFTPGERLAWFHEHCDGKRYRILVAERPEGGIAGYAATGRFRAKKAYETTVEASIACTPENTGRGLGTLLYQELFKLLLQEDIHRVVAGIAQPNAASNSLHHRFGFRTIGTFTEVGRKFGKYWDVTWMEKTLRDAV